MDSVAFYYDEHVDSLRGMYVTKYFVLLRLSSPVKEA